MPRVMSDAEVRRRKKAQAHISQTTGALGLTALGATAVASRHGRTMLRKVPAVRRGVNIRGRNYHLAKPPPKDPNRDRIKGAITPVLATSAGLGGVGAFNFAAYTSAESRKRKAAGVAKSQETTMEMGYFGEEGHPVLPKVIEAEIEKAWSPVASNYDAESSRHKRSQAYEVGALAGAGAGGAYAARHGVKAVKEAKKIKPISAVEVKTKVPFKGAKPERRAYIGRHGQNEIKAIPAKALKPAAKHGGKAAAGLAAVGLGATAASGIRRKRETGSWQSYSKSAFGVDHQH